MMMTPSGDARAALGRLLLLFVASRLLYLVLAHPDRVVNITVDELYVGTIAQELVTGLTMPFVDYRANNYSGGQLVVGALASGFFRVWGPTVFALKLVPLLFFSLALVFWFLTLQRYVSERVAVYFAVLFTFSPPFFTSHSLTALGSPTESILFTALTVFLFCRILSDPRCSLWYPALLGFTAGFALWFSYAYGLTLVILLLYWWWQDHAMYRRKPFACFCVFFVAGFSPWLITNALNHFAGLVLYGAKVWDHFGLGHLMDGLTDRRWFFPYQFLARFASDDPAHLPRWALNVAYAILFLAPLLGAAFVSLKARRSESAPSGPDHINLNAFAVLYLCTFALAVQLSDFKYTRYHLPAYPFLFMLVAAAVARLEAAFPAARRRIQTAFLTSVILLGIGAHSLLFSLDGAGSAFSAKGYSYASLPEYYFCRDETKPCQDQIIPRLEQMPLLSIMAKLAPEDQGELSREVVTWLAYAMLSDSRAGEFARIKRLIPPGFDRHFYYVLGNTAMYKARNDLSKAVASVDFLRQQSTESYHSAVFGIYRAWSRYANLDATPESLTDPPIAIAPEVQPHYWRALGHYAARYWYETDHSLEPLHAHLPSLLIRLVPQAQRYALQGVGRFLFSRWKADPIFTLPFAPAELERFPQAYHQGLFQGAGMYLREIHLFPPLSWHSDKRTLWKPYTRGLSETSVSYIHEGEKQFLALFEGPASSALEGPRHAP